jgi:glyoxylase-like metal-dependent hydrolase (beta-lactamase superfamily II)
MLVRKLVVGDLQTNCYILWDEKSKKGAVIDPGGDYEEIEKVIQDKDLDIKYIILTHGHIDHIAALTQLKNKTSALILIHPADSDMLVDPTYNLSSFTGENLICPKADRFLDDGDKIEVGASELEVLHTPGHSPGGISLFTDKMIFTGDALFCGGIGRTDFPGASHTQLLRSIKEKILSKPDDTVVYPGHGPETIIGEEKKNNPWIRGDLD